LDRCWGLCKLGCLCWGFQDGVFKLVRSSWVVQVGVFCEFLVSILGWSKPPHHVKVIHSGRYLHHSPTAPSPPVSDLPSLSVTLLVDHHTTFAASSGYRIRVYTTAFGLLLRLSTSRNPNSMRSNEKSQVGSRRN
jgi:hypothetical protein